MILLLVIFIGILFDIVGVSVTGADESVFHSMSSKKVRGASVAVKFKKNADKVSSFLCDVIGDICGIISGACGTIITTSISTNFHFDLLFTGLSVAAIIAALTIGGKAIGKSFAVNNSNEILYNFAKFVSYFNKFANIFGSVKSLIATISYPSAPNICLNARRPIRPKPFIATFTDII